MVYYNGELLPLLSSHPDIQKAWKAWDDIIFFWEKLPKNDLLQSAGHSHEQGQEANFFDNGLQDVVGHKTPRDLASVKNSEVTELAAKPQEAECRQNPEDDDLK